MDSNSQDSFFVAHSMNRAIDQGRYEAVDAFGGFDMDDDGNYVEDRSPSSFMSNDDYDHFEIGGLYECLGHGSY